MYVVAEYLTLLGVLATMAAGLFVISVAAVTAHRMIILSVTASRRMVELVGPTLATRLASHRLRDWVRVAHDYSRAGRLTPVLPPKPSA